MNTMFTLIIVVQVVSALVIIGLVLLQHGKGADMGAAFGSGASGSLFGASGSSNFLSRSTAVAAAIFFAATMALAYWGAKPVTATGGVMDRLPVPGVSAPVISDVPGAPSPVSPVPGASSDVPGADAAAGAAPAGEAQTDSVPK